MHNLIACHECDQLHHVSAMPDGGVARCVRCGAVLRRRMDDSPETVLALALAGAVLFAIANAFPLLTMRIGGDFQEATLMSGVLTLARQGMPRLALVVGITAIGAPFLQLALLLYVLLPLKFGLRAPQAGRAFRYARGLQPWSMLEVLLLGLLVAMVKLGDSADILAGTALYGFGALILVMAGIASSLDPQAVWPLLWTPPPGSGTPEPSASTADAAGMAQCHSCGLLVQKPAPGMKNASCPRCHAFVHARKPNAVQFTWVWLLTAFILYIPAMTLPVMTTTTFAGVRHDTILSGVVFLFQSGKWPLALIVFVASVTVPVVKIGLLLFLLLTMKRGGWKLRLRTRIYRVIELIGRWSMVDVFVVTILIALVQLRALAFITAEPGIAYFAAVVVLTMIAAQSFDPRLLWDIPPGPSPRRTA